MSLKKCENKECNEYTLADTCKKCHSKTKSPHYKFKDVRDAPKNFIRTK